MRREITFESTPFQFFADIFDQKQEFNREVTIIIRN